MFLHFLAEISLRIFCVDMYFPIFAGEMSLERLFGRGFSSVFCRECVFRASLVESFEISVGLNIKRKSGERFLF